MAITLQLANFSAHDLHVVSSPLAELMAILHSLAEPEHHVEARSIRNRVSQAADKSFLHEIHSLSPLWARYRCRLLLPLSPQPKSFAAELAAIAALPVAAFIELFADGVQGLYRGITPARTLLNDVSERDAFLKYCQTRSTARYELGLALLDDPEAMRTRLLRFLEDANRVFFRHEWRGVRDAIVHAAEFHTERIRTSSSVDVISQLHHSIDFIAEANVLRFDKLQRLNIPLAGRTLIAVPSVRIGSHLVIKWQRDFPVIIHFPLDGSDSLPLPIEAIRRRLAVFTSDTRLEIFRHLAGEPITTSELADQMGQSSAQISRELRVLRDADILRSERRGKRVYHRVDIEKVLRLGPDLISTLLR